MPENPSLAKTLRQQRKQLRLGPNAMCQQCGETEHVQEATVVLCPECRLIMQGKAASERHHPPGQANDAFAASLPANDHAALSDVQHDWKDKTLQNPYRDPLLRMTAWLRFFLDVFRYLSGKGESWACWLEQLAAALTLHFGQQWWTRLEGVSTP